VNREQIVIVDGQNYISRFNPRLLGWTALSQGRQCHPIMANIGIPVCECADGCILECLRASCARSDRMALGRYVGLRGGRRYLG
jgi:hypothetical protein